MSRKDKLLRFLFFSMLLFTQSTTSQTIERTATKEQLTSALTLNFIRHISWPHEQQKTAFNIVFLSNDSAQLQTLNELSAFDIRNIPVRIKQANTITAELDMSVIIVGEDYSDRLPLLNAQIARLPILVIAINAGNKQYFGVNIVQDQQRVSFEVNRYNLLYQGLEVDRALFLLGGTDLDIAELLKEMELKLASGRENLRQLQNRVTSQVALLKENENRLILSRQQQSKLQVILDDKIQQQFELESNFSQLETRFSILNTDYQNQLQELQSAQELLDAKQRELVVREKSLSDLSRDIEQNTERLAALKVQTDVQQEELTRRNVQLSQQENVIDRQALRLQTLGILLLTFLALLGLIFWSLRKQHKLNKKLSIQNISLENLNQDLKNTQEQLIESEKLSALGGMVAGIAHEINTPLGICVTASSHLSEKSKVCKTQFESGKIKKSQLESWLEDSETTSNVILNNVKRAAELVRSFKQVSADQISDERRIFNLNAYLEDISSNMSPLLSRHQHQLLINCDKHIELNSFPGVLSQILNNLVFNSVNHGFKNALNGTMTIKVRDGNENSESVTLDYTDDGSGISSDNIKRVFEPFFTTNRASGNTGLGMYISYNLAFSIGGSLSCLKSEKGAHFKLVLLKKASSQSKQKKK